MRPIARQCLPAFVCGLALGACSNPGSEAPVLTADRPLHLEDHLGSAVLVGSEVPEDLPQPVVWNFDEAQPGWRAVPIWRREPPLLFETEDGLSLTLGTSLEYPEDPNSTGGIYVDLPDWTRGEWAHVRVRARTSENVESVGLGFNPPADPGYPFRFMGEQTSVISDGSVQTYSLRADWSSGEWEGPWRGLAVWFWANGPASVDVLSVAVIPREAEYSDEPAGVRAEARGREYRQALYTHSPARLEYRVVVPEAGRLDLGLGVLRDGHPVTFRVSAKPENGEPEALLEELYADKESWGQHTVDLSHLARQIVTLALETESERAGTVALWGAPTLTGAARGGKPNVIFYVIDGASAEHMSLYGYNRHTTPNLERLAAEGAVFERAYSNSTWTKPSNASFMTSLHHSVLGGYRSYNDPVPANAVTLAEHMHRAGYQTGVFVANPNAGTLSDLQRGVDAVRESWEEFAYLGGENHKESSRVLHEGFWSWREAYPGEPYWVHFQTTDVHADFPTVSPFAGLYTNPGAFATLAQQAAQLEVNYAQAVYSDEWEEKDISRVAFYTAVQAFYDEAMAHNDYQIGRLVGRLKAEGEWENTLLIVAADHSLWAALSNTDMGIAIQDSVPPPWNRPMFRPSITRIPLMFVWPGHIEGGQRISQPVSLIDVLPTILDLLDLPEPEIMMGQSLAPPLLGTEGWEPRPVIFDEFRVDAKTSELRGTIEVVDGRWGASLEINPKPPGEYVDPREALLRRPVPLLLYDLWNDPYCLWSVHQEHPKLVETYTKMLKKQWEAHQALARHFSREEDVVLTAEQLETLRSLGYIQN